MLIQADGESLRTPSNLPTGYVLEEWVVAVIALKNENKVSRATVALRDPIE